MAGTREGYPRLPGAPRPAAYARAIASARDRDARDAGASLAALLVTLVLLGAMAAVVVMSVSSTTTLPTVPTTTGPTGTGGGTTTTTQSIPRLGLVTACVTNVGAVTSAIADYGVQHAGAKPPRGTAWASAYVRSWPTSPYYAITWTGTELVVRPLPHGRVAIGSAGTATPATGCYAI